jgi:hypothetical protein
MPHAPAPATSTLQLFINSRVSEINSDGDHSRIPHVAELLDDWDEEPNQEAGPLDSYKELIATLLAQDIYCFQSKS